MGARLVKYDFNSKNNEQIEAVVKVPEEKRSIIYGTVVDCDNKPVKDAVVKLFEVIRISNSSRIKPITHTFTDENGAFLFGPLQPYKDYSLKVWYDDVKVKKVIFDKDKEDQCDDTGDSFNNDDASDGDYHIVKNDVVKNEVVNYYDEDEDVGEDN